MNAIGLAGVVASGLLIPLAIAYVWLDSDIPSAAIGCFLGLCVGSGLFIGYAILAGWWPEGPLIATLPMVVFLAGGTFLGGYLVLWIEARKAAS